MEALRAANEAGISALQQVLGEIMADTSLDHKARLALVTKYLEVVSVYSGMTASDTLQAHEMIGRQAADQLRARGDQQPTARGERGSVLPPAFIAEEAARLASARGK